MKRILPLVFFLISYSLFSQQVFIKGKIVDSESGEGVSFAHIGICGKSIGTVANDNGDYEFRIPDSAIEDTLCATSIGYKTFKLAVEELKGLHDFNIDLPAVGCSKVGAIFCRRRGCQTVNDPIRAQLG